jgi:hypothetical protein
MVFGNLWEVPMEGSHIVFSISLVFSILLVTVSKGGLSLFSGFPNSAVPQPQQFSAKAYTATAFSRRLILDQWRLVAQIGGGANMRQ